MRLPFNTLLWITYKPTSVGPRYARIVEVKKELSGKSDSLDNMPLEVLVLAGEKEHISIINHDRGIRRMLRPQEIKKWRVLKPTDLPLIVNWEYLSSYIKKRLFGA